LPREPAPRRAGRAARGRPRALRRHGQERGLRVPGGGRERRLRARDGRAGRGAARPLRRVARTLTRSPGGRWDARRVARGLAGLAVLVAFARVLARSLTVTTLDAAEKQRAYFGDRPPPFGLVAGEAVVLPTGDTLVRFTRSGAERRLPDEVAFIEYRSQ